MVLVLPLIAASIAVSGAEPVRVGVFLPSAASAPRDVLKAFQEEVERIVRLPGTELAWRYEIAGSESFHRVLVLRLKGSCTARLPQRPARPATLGSTHVNNGRVLPFIDVVCDQVTSALARNWSWPGDRVAPELYGRALARVAAHEIYHALTESVVHDEEGVTKASFDRHDLAVRKLVLAPPALARLERALGLVPRPAD